MNDADAEESDGEVLSGILTGHFVNHAARRHPWAEKSHSFAQTDRVSRTDRFESTPALLLAHRALDAEELGQDRATIRLHDARCNRETMIEPWVGPNGEE